MTKLNLLFPASPAPGYRDAGNNGRLGALAHVGNYGFGYSSSVSGSTGVYLNFDVAHLYPSYASSRAFGFQLRCLSE